jgi:hypothetical protein
MCLILEGEESMKNRLISIAALSLLSGSALAQQVFFTDFDAGVPSEITGGGSAVGVRGFAGFGNAGNTFGGNFYRNASVSPIIETTLTLNNLPTHDSLSIRFLLAFINSWDSDNGNPSPDLFQVRVDGNLVLSITAANASGSNTYGGDQIAPWGAYWFGGYNDRGFDLGSEAALQNIPHTASSVVIEFSAAGAGWQGGDDESWGIDNLGVSVVPAPGTLALTGLAGLLTARRRSR